MPISPTPTSKNAGPTRWIWRDSCAAEGRACSPPDGTNDWPRTGASPSGAASGMTTRPNRAVTPLISCNYTRICPSRAPWTSCSGANRAGRSPRQQHSPPIRKGVCSARAQPDHAPGLCLSHAAAPHRPRCHHRFRPGGPALCRRKIPRQVQGCRGRPARPHRKEAGTGTGFTPSCPCYRLNARHIC